jgi:hypothetical protein
MFSLTVMMFIATVLSLVTALAVAYLLYKIRLMNGSVISTEGLVSDLLADVTRNMQHLSLLSHELALPGPLPLLRGWAASPDVLLLVVRQIVNDRLQTVVELGSGASTVILARALKKRQWSGARDRPRCRVRAEHPDSSRSIWTRGMGGS